LQDARSERTDIFGHDVDNALARALSGSGHVRGDKGIGSGRKLFLCKHCIHPRKTIQHSIFSNDSIKFGYRGAWCNGSLFESAPQISGAVPFGSSRGNGIPENEGTYSSYPMSLID